MALIAPPGTVSGPAQFIRRHRPSPEIALLGLYEISKMLNGAARLDQTLGNVVNVLTSFLDMRLGMIVILDGEEEPEIVATAGWASEVKGKPIETLPRAVIDRLIATSTPVVIEDIAKDPLFAKAAEIILSRLDGHVSFLGVPIKSDDKVIGTLSIDRVWDHESAIGFDDDLSFLKMVANLVGQTVRLHRMLSAERKRFLDERRTLEKALDQQLAETRAPVPKIGGIVGESAAIRKVMETIAVVAKSNTTVLLRGESGTGKELFARAIHDLSPRKSKAFIKLNCAARNCSVMRRAPSPVPSASGRDGSNSPTGGPSCSLKSARFRRASRPSSCGCCRRANSNASAARAPSKWTCGSSARTCRNSRASRRRHE